MNKLFLLVIGMSIVTYLPRMLPLVILKKIELPPFIKRFLGFVPYAVLGALIFPAILESTNNLGSAIFGGIVSLVIAYFKVNIIFVVFGGIAGVYFWNMI